MLSPVHFVYVSVGLAEIERGCRLMIRFDKVSFTYQESLQNGGLRDVDLIINKGECVLLCGRSGCGKTTLTRLVNGLIPYFYPGEVTGTTYVDGKDIQDYPMYEVSEHVGSVFQNPRSQFFNVDTDSEISFGGKSVLSKGKNERTHFKDSCGFGYSPSDREKHI